MGFKCSVLGHRFEEPGLVHEREPRGDDVITIRRKVMVCTLCGKQRVLAENKEITKGKRKDDEDDKKSEVDETVDDNTDDTIDDNTRDIDETTNNTRDIDDINTDRINNIDTDETNERSEIETDERSDIDAGECGRDEPIEGIAGTKSETEGIDVTHEQDATIDITESSVDTRQDNGIVLSDGEERRGYGEWPDESRETETDGQWDPDGFRSQSASASTDFEKNDHTDSTAIDAETDTGEIITDKQSDSKAEQNTTEELSSTEDVRSSTEELYCPSCGFTVTAPDSAFRSGDSCPECQKEYLIE